MQVVHIRYTIRSKRRRHIPNSLKILILCSMREFSIFFYKRVVQRKILLTLEDGCGSINYPEINRHSPSYIF